MQCLTTVTTLCNQEDCQGDFQQAMQAVPFVSKRQSSLFYHILIHFTLEHFASLTDNGVNWFKVLSCVGFWSLENLKGHEAGEGPQRERYAVQNPGGKHNLGQLVTRHHKTAGFKLFWTVSRCFKMFQAHPNTAGEIQGQTLAVWIQCSAKRGGARRLEADLQELQKLGCKAWHNIS